MLSFITSKLAHIINPILISYFENKKINVRPLGKSYISKTWNMNVYFIEFRDAKLLKAVKKHIQKQNYD